MSISSLPIRWIVLSPWKVRTSNVAHAPSFFVSFSQRSFERLPKWSMIIFVSIGEHRDGHQWKSWWERDRRAFDPLHLYCCRSKEAYSVARQFNLIPPTGEQSEYNFFQREKVEVLLPDVFHKIGQLFFWRERERETLSHFPGIGTMTWSPLACGILTGKYEDGVPLHSRAALKVIERRWFDARTNDNASRAIVGWKRKSWVTKEENSKAN